MFKFFVTIIIFFDKSIVANPNNNEMPIDAIPVPNCIIPIGTFFIITNGDPTIPIIDVVKNPTQPAPVAKGTRFYRKRLYPKW